MLYGCVPGLLAGLGGIEAVAAPPGPISPEHIPAFRRLREGLGLCGWCGVPLRDGGVCSRCGDAAVGASSMPGGHPFHRPVPYAEAERRRIEPQRPAPDLSTEQRALAADPATRPVVRTPARSAMSLVAVAALLGLGALDGGRR